MTATARLATIARQAAALSLFYNATNTPSFAAFAAPKFELNIPAKCHERQVRDGLLRHMLALPAEMHEDFVATCPPQYKEYLWDRAQDAQNMWAQWGKKHTYNSNYKRKPKAAKPVTTRKAETKESLAAPVATVAPALTVPAYSDALSYYDSEWPARPYEPTSQYGTPAAKAGVTDGMKAISEKSKTAAATKADKFAAVTAKIMSGEQPHSKSKQFKTPTYKQPREKMSDRYGDSLRAAAAEAGI